ncbi:hypothetical protein ACIA5C_43740 [Actinoplanes sp. NPDC051343]
MNDYPRGIATPALYWSVRTLAGLHPGPGAIPETCDITVDGSR